MYLIADRKRNVLWRHEGDYHHATAFDVAWDLLRAVNEQGARATLYRSAEPHEDAVILDGVRCVALTEPAANSGKRGKAAWGLGGEVLGLAMLGRAP